MQKRWKPEWHTAVDLAIVARVYDTTWAGESDDEDGQLEGGRSSSEEREFGEHGYNDWEVGFASRGIRNNLKDEFTSRYSNQWIYNDPGRGFISIFFPDVDPSGLRPQAPSQGLWLPVEHDVEGQQLKMNLTELGSTSSG